MFYFLLIVIFIICFYYLKHRIDVLEYKISLAPPIKEEEKEEVAETKEVSPKEKEVRVPQAAPEAPPAPPQAPEEILGKEFEFKLGSKIFTGIGALAVIMGVGFFLRYAFDNNLITETVRVILGIIGGLALLVVGEFSRKRFPTYSQIVTGGGLGLLYLSLYAAFNFYHIFSQPVAFLGMIVVTATGVFLAVRYNSVSLAGFAQLGGFITPLLLSTGTNNPHGLFPYIALLDIGILAIARWKLWRFLTLESFAGTVLIYSLWYFKFYTSSQLGIAEGYATLFFIIFLLVSLLQYYLQKSPQDEADVGLLAFNPILYFLISYTTINTIHPEWMGFFTAMLAVLYLFLAFIARGATEVAFRFQQILITISFLFFVIAIPIQFDKPWVVIGWSVLALATTFLGFQIRSKLLRGLSQILYLISFIRLIFFDRMILEKTNPILNERFLAFIVCFVLFSIGALIYCYRKQEISKEENNLSSVLLIESGIIFLTVGSLEIVNFFSLWQLPVFWAFSSVIIGLISLSLRDFPFRFVSYGLFILSFFYLLSVVNRVDVLKYTPIFNTRVLSFILTVLAMGIFLYLTQNKKDILLKEEKDTIQPILFFGINFLIIWLISVEILGYFNKQYRQLSTSDQGKQFVTFKNLKNVYLSVSWTIYAIILLIIGILRKFTLARILALLLFGIVIFKVFLYDTANLNNFYRFVSFIVLGTILLLSGYLYYRYRERITEFIKVDYTTDNQPKT